MFITEQNGTQMWAKMLKENFNVTDNEKLGWVSEYAAVHEIHESALGINATPSNPAVAGVNGLANIPSAQAGATGTLYATPLNTLGMGNPMMPGLDPATGQVPMGGSAGFFKAPVGSGEIPVSTLPMALNVALLTIGLELVPVIPAKGPWAMLTYMDFPYAGGKLGRKNEIANLDGIGEGKENKPLYVKVLDVDLAIAGLREALKAEALLPDGASAEEHAKSVIEIVSNSGMVLKGAFKQYGLMDAGLIIEVHSAKDGDKNVSIMSIFNDGIKSIAGVTVNEGVRVDFAQTSVDFVDGFANFFDGGKHSMSRAQNETGTGNVIGLRLFSKWIEMGSYEVTGQVTRQQLQDLPLYGVDAVSKVMEAMQNEITQTINARILEHVFALGVTNALHQRTIQGADLNLHMGTTATTMAKTTIRTYADIYGVEHKASWGEIKNSEVNTSAENLSTRQRRIMSRILAAANLIQQTGRRGRPTWIVTNTKIATALQDCSGYVVAPMVNNMAQDGSQNLFLAGSVAGLKVYVDPYMTWDDTRICIGRKGNGNEPGVIFMPYILADTVSITAEGTMAPKMLVNSRYAIADAGFFPEAMYYTFVVDCPEFDII